MVQKRLALLFAVGFTASASAQNPADLTPRDKTEVFIQHLVKVAKIDPARYQALVLEYEIGAALSELTHDLESDQHAPDGDCCGAAAVLLADDFVQSALKELHPDYTEALRLYDDGKLGEGRSAARSLSSKADPYVSAYARLLEAETEFATYTRNCAKRRESTGSATIEAEPLEKVIELCEAIGKKDRLYLIQDHRACELIALSFEKLERPLYAFVQYTILLTDYYDLPPDVEERVKRKLATLSETSGRPLLTVGEWMNKVEKLLGKELTAEEPTQAQETQIVSALDKLIELQEARERRICRNCGGT